MRIVVLAALGACGGTAPEQPVGNAVRVTAPAAHCVAATADDHHTWLEATPAGSVLQICRWLLPEGKDRSVTDACIGVDIASGAVTEVPPPADVPSVRGPHPYFALRAGKPQVCTAHDACRPLGPHAAKELASYEVTEVSDDATLAAFSPRNGYEDVVWDIGRDAPIAYPVPDPPGTRRYRFDGALVVGSWLPCAGPCTRERYFRRDAKVIIDEVAGSVAVAHLADHRLVTMATGIAIYDPVRAERVGQIAVVPADTRLVNGSAPDDEPMPGPLVVLPGDELAAVYRIEAGIEVAIVSLRRAAVARSFHIPSCTHYIAPQ